MKTLKPVPFPPLQKEFTEVAKPQQVAGLSLSLLFFYFFFAGGGGGWGGKDVNFF